MTQISTRSSIVAIKEKTTEGAFDKPAANDDFITIQPDFSITPAFASVASLELKNDIMAGRTTITGETPTGTLSHYWKGSGTSGTEPDFGPLLKSTFGEVRTLASEVTVASGSTKTVVKVGDGDLSKFKKGDTILIKDETNGWNLRPISLVVTSGDDKGLNLAYALEKAVADTTKIAKFVTYVPKNDDLPLYDVWHYFGGGADGLEAVQNARTTGATISATANDNINCSYSFQGTNYKINDTDLQTSGKWLPAGLKPTYNTTQPIVARGLELYVGAANDSACLNSPTVSLAIATPVADLTSVCSDSGKFATVTNSRTATLTVSSFLASEDSRFFSEFRQGDKVSFAFVGGTKKDSKWVDGNSFGIYGSEAVISSFSLANVSDVFAINLTLECYSPGDGSGSIFATFI